MANETFEQEYELNLDAEMGAELDEEMLDGVSGGSFWTWLTGKNKSTTSKSSSTGSNTCSATTKTCGGKK